MSILLQLSAAACIALLVVAGAVLILTGFIGRARPTRPRCSACRVALRGTVEIPPTCPSCGAALSVPGAVRFGGYRFGWRECVVGVLLISMPYAPAYITSMVLPAPGAGLGIPIERNPSAARFAQVAAPMDTNTWIWIRGHLMADVLGGSLRREAAALAIESTRAGMRDDHLDAAIVLLGELVDESALAEAMLDAASALVVSAEDQGSGGVRITVEWDDPAGLTRRPEHPLQRVYGIVGVSLDGQRTRPVQPGPRASVVPQQLTTFIRVDPSASRGGEAPTTHTLTVEVELAVMREPPEEFTRWRIAGPPAAWPNIVARRTVVVDVELSLR